MPSFAKSNKYLVKVIITGTTGMVGEGVMLECLANPEMTEVLSVSRKPSGVVHPKLKECIVPDFLSLKKDDERLSGYNACFFCAGVSSIGMKEDEFRRNTYDTTLTFAHAVNPNPQMSFVYVSGRGTNSAGKMMWARVKGKTENDLMNLPFKQVFAFRPGIMIPTQGQKRIIKGYKYLSWLITFWKWVSPESINTLQQVGQAMIYAAQHGYEKNVVEVRDIIILANRAKERSQ